MTEAELIQVAINVRGNAHAPYSKFAVGAALLTKSGKLFTGCNVENSSYGLTVCAERNAIGAMVVAGCQDLAKVVVAASPLASPCGACRQSIVEFGTEIEIVSVDPEDIKKIQRWTICELIPDHFKFDR